MPDMPRYGPTNTMANSVKKAFTPNALGSPINRHAENSQKPSTLNLATPLLQMLPRILEHPVRSDHLSESELLIRHPFYKQTVQNIEIGPNGELHSSKSPSGYLQRNASKIVEQGVVTNDPNTILQGLKAFQYTFSYVDVKGNFMKPDSSGQLVKQDIEEYLPFLQSFADSVLLLRDINAPEQLLSQFEHYIPLIKQTVTSNGFEGELNKFLKKDEGAIRTNQPIWGALTLFQVNELLKPPEPENRSVWRWIFYKILLPDKQKMGLFQKKPTYVLQEKHTGATIYLPVGQLNENGLTLETYLTQHPFLKADAILISDTHYQQHSLGMLMDIAMTRPDLAKALKPKIDRGFAVAPPSDST